MKSPMASPDAFNGPLSAFGRLLDVCTAVEQQGLDVCSAVKQHGYVDEVDAGAGSGVIQLHSEPAMRVISIPPRIAIEDLADGPYFVIVAQLCAGSLACIDSVCRLTRDLNRASGGPWQALGKRQFHGLELDGEDLFEGDLGEDDGGRAKSMMLSAQLKWPRSQLDWKLRYGRFRHEVRMFRSPFIGSEINEVEQADEIAYCRCKLRPDVLDVSECGVYLEVEVHTNSDNVSLAVVDFEGGGCSSVTFSPDTGAVIRERKVREAPRKVEGAYIQPLTTITSGQGFVGSMGLYLCGGHLAFFRRHSNVASETKSDEPSPWESTGYVTDLSWAEGRQLTPCLAFRDVGTYQVHITYVGSAPPVATERTTSAYEESSWRSLHWDAGEQDALDALEV